MNDSIHPSEGHVAKYGLPTEVKFCRSCVISNQRPSSVVEFRNRPSDVKPTIGFDDKGVCSACNYVIVKNAIDWKHREAELVDLCNRNRSKNGSYDCIVPGSGGKDSAFTAHILKYKYGMNPLTITWAPHIYTEIGWKNFQRWIGSGLDNYLYSPNGKLHRLLTRLAFENLVHPFQPFIIGQRLVGPRMSALYGIPLVFYGENQAEYGNNISDNDRPTMDMSFFYGSQANLSDLVLGGVPAVELIERYGVQFNDLNPYMPFDGERLRDVGTQVHYLGYYLKWDPQECYYYAVEHTGFEANAERTEGSYSKYSSIDDRIDPLHYYTTYIKFGIGRATYDAAIDLAIERRADAIVSVSPVSDHPYLSKTLGPSGEMEDFVVPAKPVNRRQELPEVFGLNGAIYLIRPEVLAASRTWYPTPTHAYVMPPERSIDVDTPWDLYLADLVLRNRVSRLGDPMLVSR